MEVRSDSTSWRGPPQSTSYIHSFVDSLPLLRALAVLGNNRRHVMILGGGQITRLGAGSRSSSSRRHRLGLKQMESQKNTNAQADVGRVVCQTLVRRWRIADGSTGQFGRQPELHPDPVRRVAWHYGWVRAGFLLLVLPHARLHTSRAEIAACEYLGGGSSLYMPPPLC
jgi:hypothetical protein